MPISANQPFAQTDLAILAATSGHSGVDRNLKNLIPALSRRGVRIDLLHIEGHGPYLPEPLPSGVRVVPLGTRHVNTAFPALVRYLKTHRPRTLLSDKDKVNRLAIVARMLASSPSQPPTQLSVRLGITLSERLAGNFSVTRWLKVMANRQLYPKASNILVPSQGVADDLQSLLKLPRSQIVVVPNPVVTDELLAKAKQPAGHPWLDTPNLPVILGVGELSPRKDFATLLQAFVLVRRQQPCRLLILGRGREKDRLLKLAAELGILADVALPGFVDNPHAYMARAQLLVSSSRAEGFSNVLAEALALGIPAVATDCPSGPREILADGQFGPLVPIGDHQALAQAILQTLANPLPASALRQAAVPYTLEGSADSYLRALGLTTHGHHP